MIGLVSSVVKGNAAQAMGGDAGPIANRARLVVIRFQFGDDFLGIGGCYLQEPACATPSSNHDDHLNIGGLASHGFDGRGGFILGAGLQVVFAGGGLNGEPAAIG